MSVSKRFGSLCSGPRGSEVGGERGRWVTGSRLDRAGSAVRCSLAFAAMYAMAGRPGPRASDVHVELLGTAWTG